MKTLKVDGSKRVRIPDAKPRQVFAYENNGQGTITLTLVNGSKKERFPPGSLKKYITPKSDREMLELLKGCSLVVAERESPNERLPRGRRTRSRVCGF